jgi:hypothetical protein
LEERRNNPTRGGNVAEKGLVKNSLKENMSRLNRKIFRLTNGELIKVQGDWGKGCNADCNYKQPPRWSGESKASLENFGIFMKNIDTVICKLLSCLKKELGV